MERALLSFDTRLPARLQKGVQSNDGNGKVHLQTQTYGGEIILFDNYCLVFVKLTFHS